MNAGASTGQATPKINNRILSIDISRGFALVCMVLVHFMIYYGDEATESTWPYFLLNDGLADWGAAVFLMMMGMSQVLSTQRRKEPNDMAAFKRILLRGGYLFVVGLVMLLLAFGPGDMWRWDILTLMGFATVVLFFCRFAPSWLLLALCVAIAVLSPIARGSFDTATAWGNAFVPVEPIDDILPGMFVDPVEEYQAVWQVGKIIKGFFLTGYFPVMPWVIFAIIGFVLGRRLARDQLRRDLPWLFAIGGAFLLAGLGMAELARSMPPSLVVDGFVAPLSFYPDSFTMINVQVGMSLVAFSVLYWWYDVRRPNGLALGPLARMFTRTSRFSLSFYFIHYQILGWPLVLIYLITGRYLLTEFTNAYGALFCGLACVGLLELLLPWWEKRGAKYSLEWCLGVLSFRLAPHK